MVSIKGKTPKPVRGPHRVGYFRDGTGVRLFVMDEALGVAVELKGVTEFSVQADVVMPLKVKIEMYADPGSWVQLSEAPC